MNDTTPEAEEVRLRILRAMPPCKRLALASGWSSSLRAMIKSRLRQDFPEASESELKQLFSIRWLGPELAGKVYGLGNANG